MFDLLKMLPLETMAKQFKPEVPKYLQALTDLLAAEAGAQPGERVGVLLFSAPPRDGKPVTMCTAYRLDERDQPQEAIGTIDVGAAIDRLDIGALIAAAR